MTTEQPHRGRAFLRSLRSEAYVVWLYDYPRPFHHRSPRRSDAWLTAQHGYYFPGMEGCR